jgi:hypothetical protein
LIDPTEIAATPTHCIICGAVVPHERVKFKSTTCSDEHSKERKARMRRDDRNCLCVICTKPIGADRARYSAITCSPEHGALRKQSIRARVDMKRCRVCSRPATPVERAAFRRFRKLELQRPDILYPAAFKRWQEEGGDLESFAQELSVRLARADAGDCEVDLGLIDRRSKEAPGGPKSGRPRVQWEGGDADCVHQLPIRRKGGKPIPAAKSNRCRRCSAIRVGMAQREPDPVTEKQEEIS